MEKFNAVSGMGKWSGGRKCGFRKKETAASISSKLFGKIIPAGDYYIGVCDGWVWIPAALIVHKIFVVPYPPDLRFRFRSVELNLV